MRCGNCHYGQLESTIVKLEEWDGDEFIVIDNVPSCRFRLLRWGFGCGGERPFCPDHENFAGVLSLGKPEQPFTTEAGYRRDQSVSQAGSRQPVGDPSLAFSLRRLAENKFSANDDSSKA
jgi:hypothetical protein